MAQEFWVRSSTGDSGPFSPQQIRQLAADGKLKPTHQVTLDQKRWVAASTIGGLTFKTPGNIETDSDALTVLPAGDPLLGGMSWDSDPLGTDDPLFGADPLGPANAFPDAGSYAALHSRALPAGAPNQTTFSPSTAVPASKPKRRLKLTRELILASIFLFVGLIVLVPVCGVLLWVVTQPQSGNFKGPTSQVNCMSFSPDSRRVVTGSRDKTVQLWKLNSGRELMRFDGHEAEIHCVAFSADGKYILSGAGDRNTATHCDVRLWNAATGKELRRFPTEGGYASSVTFLADGKSAATLVGRTGRVQIWDLATGNEIPRFPKCFSGRVTFQPDRRQLAVAANDRIHVGILENRHFVGEHATSNRIRLLSLENGEEETSFELALPPLAKQAHLITVSPTFRHAIGTWFSVTSGTREIGAGGKLLSDNTTTDLGNPVLSELENGKKEKTLPGHEQPILNAAFSPDGTMAFTAQKDKIRVWNVKAGAFRQEIPGKNVDIYSLAIAPRGDWLICQDYEGYLRLIKVHK